MEGLRRIMFMYILASSLIAFAGMPFVFNMATPTYTASTSVKPEKREKIRMIKVVVEK